jgi:hypothetical protein
VLTPACSSSEPSGSGGTNYAVPYGVAPFEDSGTVGEDGGIVFADAQVGKGDAGDSSVADAAAEGGADAGVDSGAASDAGGDAGD